MKRIYVWETEENKKLFLDLDKENIRFIFLWWATGTWKSIFHFNFYKQLVEKYTPNEIWFMLLDFPQVDFIDWRWEYLIHLPTYDVELSFIMLENLLEDPDRYWDKKIFIHIEENELSIKDNKRFIEILQALKKNNKNVYIIYSTSRLQKENLENIIDMMDLKVIFWTYTNEDSLLLLWNESASKFKRGERVLIFNDTQIFCEPFPQEVVKEAMEFYNKMVWDTIIDT